MSRVLVVGSGIAGLLAALRAEAAGCRVQLVTKTVLAESNTRYAQGGIAAALDEHDSVAAHALDTLTAGAHRGDPAVVGVTVTEGPARIRELADLGVAFDRTASGDLALGREAAHAHPRIVHAGGDATGAAIVAALIARVGESGIEVVENAFLLDLLLTDGRVSGAELLIDGRREAVAADAVVLATGGAGRLFAHTTNPAVATGDGIAAALRAGAVVRDLEFVQFHPTVLVAGGDAFLVSEAVRGEGAVLLDQDGRRFAFDAHPDGELAPRDVVARAIARRMAEQDGAPVFLDARALGAAFLAERFPTIDRTVRARGWDWSTTPMPVTPAAHYLMGGVATDTEGRTSIPGLYAVGETAHTGLHGANRLASNSLLEAAVFGARAGEVVATDAASRAWTFLPSPPSPVNGSGTSGHPTAASARFSRTALQELLWENAGLIRTAAGLRTAAATIAGWRGTLPPPGTVRDAENANLLLIGERLVAAALARTESVGAHFRADAASAATADQWTGAMAC